jgi:hypothetical protein
LLDEEELEDGFEDDEDDDFGSAVGFAVELESSGASILVYSSIINKRNPSKARNPMV